MERPKFRGTLGDRIAKGETTMEQEIEKYIYFGANSYQEDAMRTNDGLCHDRLCAIMDKEPNIAELLNGCLGLAGEAGEFNDMVKKWIFHGKELDREHLEKELGDVLWYVALICDAMGFKMSEVMLKNIAKLKARYPEGFSVNASNNRKDGDV